MTPHLEVLSTAAISLPWGGVTLQIPELAEPNLRKLVFT